MSELKVYSQCYDGTDGLFYLKSEANKVIAHNKYKRCLANANYWVAISYHCVDDKHRKKAEKRHYKWLELAEKFKEADDGVI